MSEPALRPGQLVTSCAGRDRGRAFLVIGLAGERYALLADGRTRPVARPKRKNVRHLQAQGAVPQALAARLRAGEPLTDRDVREAMAQWQPSPAPPVQDVPIGLVV